MRRNVSNGKIISFVAAFICVVVFTNVFQLSIHDVKASGKVVKVAYYQSDNFQEGMTDDAVKYGYSYEYLQKIAYMTGWEYEYVYGNWSELYSAFVNGQIDVMAGVSKTSSREGLMLFPNSKMGTENYFIYKHQTDDTISREEPSSLDGKTIGCIRNNVMTSYAQIWITENSVQAAVRYYNSFAECNQAFYDGEIDAIVSTDNNVDVSSRMVPVFDVGGSDYYLAVSNSREDLLEDLNAAQLEINVAEPYFVSNLQDKYFGQTAAAYVLTNDEIEWISRHDRIYIGYINDYRPFCWTDNNGQVNGLITDVAEQIISQLNLSADFEVNYIGYDSYAQMLQGLKNHEVNVIFPETVAIWYSEQNDVYETSEVVSVPLTLIYKGEYDDSKFNRIAISNHSPIQRIVVETNYPNSTIVEVSSPQECLEAVLDGRADSTIFASFRADNEIGNGRYDQLRTLALGVSYSFCMGVNRGDTTLLSILDKGLLTLDRSSMSGIIANYINGEKEVTLASYLRSHIGYVFMIGGVFVALIIGAFVFYLIISRRAQNKLQLQLEENEKLTIQKEKQLDEINLMNVELEEKMGVISTMSSIYFAAYYINLRNNTFIEIKAEDYVREVLGLNGNAQIGFNNFCDKMVQGDNTAIKKFVDMSTIDERLSNRKSITCDFVGNVAGWTQLYLIAGERDVNNKLITVIAAARTIHDEKAREEEQNRKLDEARIKAESASSAKTSFLFNMSHDLRTPMNAIIGFRDLLERNQDDPIKRQDYLQKIGEASGVLLSIINNVLEMSRIEKGVLEKNETVGNVSSFIKMIESVFKEMMQQKNIEFLTKIDVQHTEVYCDIIKLREVFINLVSNAYKYTNCDGKVVMSIKELPSDDPEYALFQTIVMDNGIGMSEEFLPKLFDEFSREKNTTANKIEGTGLGMPIVKRLVEFMGGTIEVKSHVGEGTVFTVTMKHKIAEEEEKPEIASKSNEVSFDGRRILLVEDNEFNAEIAIEILSATGFIIEHADDGNVAVEMVEKNVANYYDLVLMDVQMPTMNGYDATRAIRKLADKKKASVPILAMTANAFEEDKQAAIDAGMNGHLAKPINIGEVLSELSNILTKMDIGG